MDSPNPPSSPRDLLDPESRPLYSTFNTAAPPSSVLQSIVNTLSNLPNNLCCQTLALPTITGIQGVGTGALLELACELSGDESSLTIGLVIGLGALSFLFLISSCALSCAGKKAKTESQLDDQDLELGIKNERQREQIEHTAEVSLDISEKSDLPPDSESKASPSPNALQRLANSLPGQAISQSWATGIQGVGLGFIGKLALQLSSNDPVPTKIVVLSTLAGSAFFFVASCVISCVGKNKTHQARERQLKEKEHVEIDSDVENGESRISIGEQQNSSFKANQGEEESQNNQVSVNKATTCLLETSSETEIQPKLITFDFSKINKAEEQLDISEKSDLFLAPTPKALPSPNALQRLANTRPYQILSQSRGTGVQGIGLEFIAKLALRLSSDDSAPTKMVLSTLAGSALPLVSSCVISCVGKNKTHQARARQLKEKEHVEVHSDVENGESRISIGEQQNSRFKANQGVGESQNNEASVNETATCLLETSSETEIQPKLITFDFSKIHKAKKPKDQLLEGLRKVNENINSKIKKGKAKSPLLEESSKLNGNINIKIKKGTTHKAWLFDALYKLKGDVNIKITMGKEHNLPKVEEAFEDFRNICVLLAQNENITSIKLDISNCSLRSNTVKPLEDLASKLTELNIACNYLTDAGTATIAKLTKLQWLNISSNNFGYKGAATIAQLTNLRWLDIHNNALQARGATAIAQRLKDLEWLNISLCGIGNTGADTILQQLIQLRVLDMSYNQLSKGEPTMGAPAWWQLVEQLTALDIRGNSLSQEEMATINRTRHTPA